MKTSRFSLLLLGLALCAQMPASAVTLFSADITHDQEPGLPGTTPLITTDGLPRALSFGSATFILNDAMDALSFTATIFNIDVTGMQTPNDSNDNLIAAHLHAAAATGGPGTNASVVWGFFGMPANNNNPADGTMTPFLGAVGGTFTGTWNAPEGNSTNLLAQLGNIFAGRSYINFHTTQFGGGEIRGQVVPEIGSSGILLVLGVVGLLGLERRRRRNA